MTRLLFKWKNEMVGMNKPMRFLRKFLCVSLLVSAVEPRLPVVLMTAHGTIETAIEATKIGSFDYLQKFSPRSTVPTGGPGGRSHLSSDRKR